MQTYKCELCGKVFAEEHDECPSCGCPEVYEVEDWCLPADSVFGLVDEGVIPNL